MTEKTYTTVTCPKCAGRGVMQEFAATYDGVCFKCNGAKVVRVRVYTPEEEAKREARKAKRAAVEAEKIREQYAYELERRVELEAMREVANSSTAYIDSSIGETVELEGVVSFIRTVDTQYGTSLLVKIRLDYEHEVKAFTTAQWAWDANTGDRVTVRGIVKSFDEYEGRKSTQLNRVKAA